MSSVLTNPAFLKALYAGNALWHSSAFYHFCFKQAIMMRTLSKRRLCTDGSIRQLARGDAWHHDIMAYLGSINTSMALLALLRLYALAYPVKAKAKALTTGTDEGDVPIDVTALLVLGLANFSQAYMNFRTGLTADRWIMGKGFDVITVLDAVFTVLDWAAAYKKIYHARS